MRTSLLILSACIASGLLVVLWLDRTVPIAEDVLVTEAVDPTAATTSADRALSVVAPAEPTCVLLDDFTGSSELSWFAVNDGVMGGLSQGSVAIVDSTLVHSGVLNTNGGGFSHAGTRFASNTLVGYSKLQIRLNTNGRQYALNLGDARNERISHQAQIPLDLSGTWQEVWVAFDDTVPTIFSRRVNSAPVAADAINELNLILGDGQDGPFAMQVDWIKACL